MSLLLRALKRHGADAAATVTLLYFECKHDDGIKPSEYGMMVPGTWSLPGTPLSSNSCIDSPAPPVSLLFAYEGLCSQHTKFLRAEGRLTRKNAFFMSYIDVNIYSVFVIKYLASK